MKNFFGLCFQLGMIVFAGAAVMAIINWLTGWHMGFKGAEVPGDPVSAIAFAVIAGICAGLTYWMDGGKKAKTEQPE